MASSTRLIILGLLQERPFHGYELKRVTKERYMDEWGNLAFGSIYFALRRMTEEGLVIIEKMEKEGNRPSRNVYSITEAGRQEFLRLLRENWQSNELGADPIRACLVYMEALPPDEVLSYLKARRETFRKLGDHLREIQRTLDPKAPWTAQLLLERDSRLISCELDWLDGLIAIIPDRRRQPVEAPNVHPRADRTGTDPSPIEENAPCRLATTGESFPGN